MGGIGDRHLDNHLFCLRSAEVVPIDFGYSFGIGALLPVPELVLFRLTGFLLSALQPLAGQFAHGTFCTGLAAVLGCCRDRAELLQDACALFVREPLLDWTTQSRRRGITDLEFVPRRRLQMVAERLRGRHPAAILRDELMDNPYPWVKELIRGNSMEAIIAGLDEDERAEMYRRNVPLSVAEQVTCLIRQATDPNILGRAWEGWAPEI